MTNRTTLSLAETAQLMRDVLKQHFPGIRFSVTQQKQAWGSHVRIAWSGEVSEQQVRDLIGHMHGVTWDSTSESYDYVDRTIISPEGHVTRVHYSGTRPQLVHMGAS